MKKAYVGAEITMLVRALRVESVAIPFTSKNVMPWWLKTLGRTVRCNDLLAYSYWESLGIVENDDETVSDKDINGLLEGTMEMHVLDNPLLAEIVPLEDAYFFDRLRQNIDTLSDAKKGIALLAGFLTMRYAENMVEYPQQRFSLADTFRRQVHFFNAKVTADGKGKVYRLEASEFAQRAKAEMFYIQAPTAGGLPESPLPTLSREVWVQGANDGWLHELRETVKGKLGDRHSTRSSYENAYGELLEAAEEYPVWIFNVMPAEVPDMRKLIQDHRRIRNSYVFDASEVAGGYRNSFIVAEK